MWHMKAKQSSWWFQAELDDWGSEMNYQSLVDPQQWQLGSKKKKKKVTSETYDHILWIYTHWFSLWLSLFIPKAVWGILPFSDGRDEQ